MLLATVNKLYVNTFFHSQTKNMGNSSSSKRQKKKKKKIACCSDVLATIIKRLSLKEQFVCISVSQQFHLSAIQVLKQHDVLLVVSPDDGGDCAAEWEDFFEESSVKNCGCGRHKLKEKDVIDPFIFENPTTRGKILKYLPGIKVVHIDRFIKGIHTDLSKYYPNIECLVLKEYSDKLASQPQVTHFSGYLETALISKLPQAFPKLTNLCLQVDPRSKGKLNAECFQEGITRLKVSSYISDNWPTIFKSPAMRTVIELGVNNSSHQGFGDRYFVAPNLICMNWITRAYDCEDEMTFILKSLGSSPLLQKLLLQISSMPLPQKVSVSLFTSFNRLKVIRLPLLVDINKILEIVCQNNPFLEDVLVHGIKQDDDPVGLQEFSRLRNLKSLQIANEYIEDEGLSQEQLLKFVAQNQLEGQLRFLFTLHQRKDFPGNENEWPQEIHWNGIDWKYYDYCDIHFKNHAYYDY